MADYARLFRNFKLEMAAIKPPPDFALTHSAPASDEQILAVQSKLGVQLPEDLKNYLTVANGTYFGGEEVFGTDQIERWDNLIVLHAWGNGDFTVMPTVNVGEFPAGSILFANHSPDVLALIGENMAAWFVRLKTELENRSEILHPIDYRSGKHPPIGCYAGVLHQLKGIDCELNR